MSSRKTTFMVLAAEAGVRLDRLLCAHIAGLGRRQARELCAAGLVRVDGKRSAPSAPARADALVEVELPDAAAQPQPELELDVRLELAELVVVDKPAGQPSVPLAAGELGTLANALVARYPEMAAVGHRSREPGLIHRLDTQTSGLLVAARNAATFAHLKSALSAGRLEKTYLALCEDRGLADSGVIDRPLGPDPAHAERVLVYETMPEGRYARHAHTRFRVLERQHGLLLVEVEARSAMRHQIRAHLAALGHPILGDVVYGSGQHTSLGARHALHASYVAWAGDANLPSFAVRSVLPPELGRLIG